jgi:hypothetical protein
LAAIGWPSISSTWVTSITFEDRRAVSSAMPIPRSGPPRMPARTCRFDDVFGNVGSGARWRISVVTLRLETSSSWVCVPSSCSCCLVR